MWIIPKSTRSGGLNVVKGMIRYEGINPHITNGGGAKALAERKAYFREAEKIARDGMIEAGKKIDSQRQMYSTPEEYEKALGWYTGIMVDVLGWVFYNEGRLEDAERELKHAYELDPKSVDAAYHLGQVYKTKGDAEKEEESYLHGLNVERMGKNPCEDALKDLYQRRNGDLDGYAEYRSKIMELYREKRKQRILAEKLTEPKSAPAFALKTLDGKEVSLESLKGKIAAINFWGIWCGPCVQELPEFQKLHQKYQKDPDVVILAINNDQNPTDVPPWMKQKGYDFTVLMDSGYVAKAGVRTFPTTWFLDLEGRTNFVKIGWTEKLLEEFSWRIESLRKPAQ